MKLLTYMSCLVALVLGSLSQLSAADQALDVDSAANGAASEQKALYGDVSEKMVLVAAIDLGPLADLDPDLAERYSRLLSANVTKKVDFVTSQYSETLPGSTDDGWTTGPVGQMSGANLAVVTTIDSIEEQKKVMKKYKVVTVTMRAYGVHGQLAWEKTHTGRYIVGKNSAKLMTAASLPECRAAWEGIKRCMQSLCSTIDAWPESVWLSLSEKPAPVKEPLIDVGFTSIPANADIYIDGTYRGSTGPQVIVIGISVRDHEIRIERTGYEPWVKHLTPAAGMVVQPALEPIAAAPEAAPEEEAAPVPAQ